MTLAAQLVPTAAFQPTAAHLRDGVAPPTPTVEQVVKVGRVPAGLLHHHRLLLHQVLLGTTTTVDRHGSMPTPSVVKLAMEAPTLNAPQASLASQMQLLVHKCSMDLHLHHLPLQTLLHQYPRHQLLLPLLPWLDTILDWLPTWEIGSLVHLQLK